jgi:diguanylate cyclase (GGDEF)-like protein
MLLKRAMGGFVTVSALRLGIALVAAFVLIPAAAAAQNALPLDPTHSYPLYGLGPIQRNGGAWMPAGSFTPSRRASVFNRQHLIERIALRGDPSVGWVIRAQPQIDDFELIDPKTGAVEDGGMRVPFDRRRAVGRRGPGRRDPQRRVSTARENAMLHAAEVQLQRLAKVDGLTGIANRREFDERFADEWKRAARGGRELALLLIDVDFFKEFNDACGHLAGDDCLRQIAQALARNSGRPSDVCARYGGEEFAILVPDANVAQARDLGERLRRIIVDLAIPHGLKDRVVTISIGVAACAPNGGVKEADLIAAADAALYDAKRGGRNAVVERRL